MDRWAYHRLVFWIYKLFFNGANAYIVDMPIPKNKEDLLDQCSINFNRLMLDLERVSEEDALDLSMIGHAKNSIMSPHNLVSYLLGWSDLVVLWVTQRDSVDEIVFPAQGHKWNELGKLAEHFYIKYKKVKFSELINDLRSRHKEIMGLIKLLSNEDLYETSFYKQYTLGRMIQLNTSSPYKNARARIRSLLKH